MMGRDVNTNLHDIGIKFTKKKYIARKDRKITPKIFNNISKEVIKKKFNFSICKRLTLY